MLISGRDVQHYAICARLSLTHSKPPSPNMLRTLKPLAWYALTTCCMDVIIVFLDLLHISSVVPKCLCLEIVMTNGILLMAIMSMARVMSPYFSNTSLGTFFHVKLTCSVGLLVVFPFIDPKFSPKMSSALRISSLVTLQFGIILPSTYLIKSTVLGLPITFCRARAFLALEYCLTEYLALLLSTVVTIMALTSLAMSE